MYLYRSSQGPYLTTPYFLFPLYHLTVATLFFSCRFIFPSAIKWQQKDKAEQKTKAATKKQRIDKKSLSGDGGNKKLKQRQQNKVVRKKTKRRRLNKAATKKLKRRQQNKVATTKTKAVTTNKVARKKNKASTKNKAAQQNKFILQCNFIYLECLLLFFFASIVITYSLYIILKKCSYIFMILCLISKST